MAKDYFYIQAWGILLQSFGSYIQSQVELARQENAPEDATYRQQDGTWRRWSDMEDTNRNKATVAGIVDGLKHSS